MRVPLLDLEGIFRRQETQLRAAIDRVLQSQHFIMGPEVAAFEEEAAAFLGGQEVWCVGCSNGSSALLLALMALDVQPGDEVIVPAYSFFSTASCVTRLGATPVWIDIEPHTCNLDPTQLASKLSDRTRAIIPVHLFGRAVDMEALDTVLENAGRKGQVTVVEDAAQALSARYRGRLVCTFGDLSCISFFPSKNLGAFGDAGMVVAKTEALAQRVRVLSKHGAARKYFHAEVGINSRLDALQAAVLRVKLPALVGWSEERRANAARYRTLFAQAKLEAFVSLPADDGDGVFHHIYNQFTLQVEARDELQAFLKASAIGSAIYYPRPLHLQECFTPEPDSLRGLCPVAEKMSQRVLSIPIYPGLQEEQQKYVVETIARFYHTRSTASLRT